MARPIYKSKYRHQIYYNNFVAALFDANIKSIPIVTYFIIDEDFEKCYIDDLDVQNMDMVSELLCFNDLLFFAENDDRLVEGGYYDSINYTTYILEETLKNSYILLDKEIMEYARGERDKPSKECIDKYGS
jgi:hypothetical protein